MLIAETKNIVTGWKNLFVKDEAVEAIAEVRASICAACPEKKFGSILTLGKKDFEEIQHYYCGDCGCPLSPKVRATDGECPKDKWNGV